MTDDFISPPLRDSEELTTPIGASAEVADDPPVSFMEAMKQLTFDKLQYAMRKHTDATDDVIAVIAVEMGLVDA